jgi:hypothetical protein
MIRNPTGISRAFSVRKNFSKNNKTSKPKDSTNNSFRKLIRNSPKGAKYDQ